MPDGHKIGRPNGHKLYQHLPSQHPPKFTQNGIFGLKTNHLATQIATSLKLSSLSRKPRRMQIFLANSSEKNGKNGKQLKSFLSLHEWVCK
jgi:hypothetical protein